LTYHAAVLLASLGVIAIALTLRVRDERVVLPVWDVPLPEMCWFKRLTGAECPGCGSTRAVISLVHGEFLDAWHHNVGGYLFLALILFQFPYRIGQFCRIHRGLPVWRPRMATSVSTCILAAILFSQWVAKALADMV